MLQLDRSFLFLFSIAYMQKKIANIYETYEQCSTNENN